MNVFQAFLLLLLSNGLACHVIVNPMLLDASGRDAWITALVTGSIFIPWSLLIVYVMKKSGQQHWREWLGKHTHPAFSWILVAPVLLLLFLQAMETVTQTVSWHITNYLPASSPLQLGFLLLLICLMLCWWGFRAVAVAAGILLPIVVALGIFVATGNSEIKDMSLLMPVLEHGWDPVLRGMIYAGSAYVEVILILLLQHRIRGQVKTWHMLVYSCFVVVIMVGPIIGAITEFGPEEAANQITSPYEQWRMLRIGQYIEHVDFFSIFQWLSGASVRIALPVLVLAETFASRSENARRIFILALLLLYGAATLVPLDEYDMYVFMYVYFMPGALLVVLPTSLIWFVVAACIKPDRRNDTDGGQPQDGSAGPAGGARAAGGQGPAGEKPQSERRSAGASESGRPAGQPQSTGGNASTGSGSAGGAS
ncbi:endospore germination permease [Paenibacillus albicereus]|uniref:endospore germination permease n=1 Tax=Paenibacillus albicereus TaxID=2726185 RepID=UPI001F46BF4B|nr:endospore germination permease [Paenibacillus albicereus]